MSRKDGGDRTENLLWRMEDTDIPPTVEYLFIHCGTNNLCTSSCKDIADGILSTGVMAKGKSRNLKVIVGGLLHCDQDGLQLRSNVAEVNKTLKRKIGKLHQFYFMEEDINWLENDEDSLNMEYYHEDRIISTIKVMRSLLIASLENSRTSSHVHPRLLLASF